MNRPNSPASEPNRHSTCDYCGLPVSGLEITDEPAYCCFGCRFAAGMSTSSSVTAGELGPASALGFSVFFTMNVVMMTMALWSYAEQVQSPFEIALRNFLRYGAMAFSFPVLLLLGRPLASHAVHGLRRRVFTTDLLLASGVLAAFAVSVVNTIRCFGHVYFEVGCVILVLVTLGRWLEASGRSEASKTLDQLERLIPEKVRLRQSGRDVSRLRWQIVEGDLVHVLASERIPFDGRVLHGRGVVDEQFFTGESTPVEKQPGAHVLGGSLNLDGDLILEVTALSNAGALGRLVDAVRAARLSKGRYQMLSDTWSRFFFPIISVVAVGALIFHGLRVDWEFGLLTALSVVLIACPCSLALATPLAVWTALGAAAKKGVLFRSGAALETMATIRAIRWDKTGTLTTGAPRVLRLFCEQVSESAEVEQVAANLTNSSTHLYSQAIQEFLLNISKHDAITGVQTVAGRGLRATATNGSCIALGSLRWMEDCEFRWGPQLSLLLQNPIVADSPLAAVGYDGQVQGLFVLEETIRPETPDAVQQCRRLGLDLGVLTGDRKARATILAKILDLPVEAALLPQDKLDAIQMARKTFGRVAMIGDGLNDAPALAGADIGIAMGCGADVSRDSADICLLSSDLRLVPWTYRFSRRTVSTIRTNLAWSFGYNSIGVIVAAGGQLHPAVAAALMVISSLMVLGNSLRLATTDPVRLFNRADDTEVPKNSFTTSCSNTPVEPAS